MGRTRDKGWGQWGDVEKNPDVPRSLPPSSPLSLPFLPALLPFSHQGPMPFEVCWEIFLSSDCWRVELGGQPPSLSLSPAPERLWQIPECGSSPHPLHSPGPAPC